jgi:hypothetical protein
MKWLGWHSASEPLSQEEEGRTQGSKGDVREIGSPCTWREKREGTREGCMRREEGGWGDAHPSHRAHASR